MKSPLPVILRKGAVVRVADETDTSHWSAWAVTYVDLQFADGHVERWEGAGWLHEGPPAELEEPAALVEWGRDVLNDQSSSLLAELGRVFTGDTRRQLAYAPIEIVVERHAEMPQVPPTKARR